ncbi:MAG: ABC transporter ATP-binding protein [Clostridia bacterium]|nr:ABC transporter ATP-binding protein [Clostridia bacterium]
MKLFRLTKGYRKETVLSPVFKLAEAILELLIPLIVANIIDRAIPAGDTGYIVKMICLMAALGAVGFVFAVLGQYFAAKSSAGFGTRMREAVFDKIQSLSYSDLDRATAPTLINRLNSDAAQAQSGLNIVLRLVLRSPFIVVGAVVMAFTIDVRAALIFTVTVVALLLASAAVVLAGVPAFRRSQNALDRVTGITRENMTGVRVVRAFVREKEEIRSYEEATAKHSRLQKIAGNISGALNPATYVIINTALILILRSGAVRIDAGSMTQGQVIALYNYMTQMLVELLKLAGLIVMLSRSWACAGRVSAFLNEKTDSKTETPMGSPSIHGGADVPRVRFDNVTAGYGEGSEPALSSVSFSVYPGQTVGVIGSTGSGKSTLVDLIPRFYDVRSGAVLVDGVDVRETDAASLRGRCGVVPQRAVLFKGTLRENLLFGNGDATDEELREAMRLACVDDLLETHGGLDAPVAQYGRNFSGGQRQRLTVARALVRRPEILILDDSSSALDYATDAKLRRNIASLDFKPTVFIVSQRTGSVKDADLIIVLEDGEVVGMGSHDALLESCPVYREIHDAVTGGEVSE